MDVVFFASSVGALCLFTFSGNKLGKQTVFIRLHENQFSVRKFLRVPKLYHYDQIVFHCQRKRKVEKDNWLEFYVYLDNGDYFVIQSDEFNDYILLKDFFEQYGEHRYIARPGFYEDSLTRWVGRWLSLISVAGIIFGYAAHEEVDNISAQLTSVKGTVISVEKSYSKSTFRGIEVRLSNYPTFNFFADQENFTSSIKSTDEYLYLGRVVSLLIRSSENKKKIAKKERLTFGDKYVNYDRIDVFGIDTLESEKPVYEGV